LRSDPNMHRAQCGPMRVRIEARQRSGWRQRGFEKAERAESTYRLVIGMERNMEEERAHSNPAACQTFALRQRDLPAAARKSELPLSRFPLRGKPGRAGSPHAASTLCASKKRLHTSMPRLPPQEGFQSAPLNPPLRIPPIGATGARREGRLDLRNRERKFKDGRHGGPDFYDLLIEVGLYSITRLHRSRRM
jgi:hypothetical protein